MTIRRGSTCAVIFAGVAAGLPGPARAAGALLEGDYTFDGGGITHPGHATTCSPSCPCSHIEAPAKPVSLA